MDEVKVVVEIATLAVTVASILANFVPRDWCPWGVPVGRTLHGAALNGEKVREAGKAAERIAADIDKISKKGKRK